MNTRKYLYKILVTLSIAIAIVMAIVILSSARQCMLITGYVGIGFSVILILAALWYAITEE